MRTSSRARRIGAAPAVAALLWATAALVGCSTSPVLLSVTVQTDLVPGIEFNAVVITLDDGERLSSVPSFVGEDFRAGSTVATFEDLAEGTHQVDVALLDAAGVAAASQPVLVTISGTSRSITVLVVRACVGVICGDGEFCASGVCAPNACRDDASLAECPPPLCTRDDDCSARAECAEPICVMGACLSFGRDGMCGERDLCHPELGCVARPVQNPLPIALFSVTPEPLPCEETEVALDASGSLPGASGAPIVFYRWTVRAPDGETVLEMNDVGDVVVGAGIRTVGGTIRAPRINLTHYHAQSAARVRLDGSTGINQLLIGGLVLEPTERYVMRFAARSEAGGDIEVALLQDEMPFEYYGLREMVDVDVGWQSWEYELVSTPRDPMLDARLRFIFPGVDVFWIDRVQLIRVVDGTRLVDTSFESGAGAWFTDFSVFEGDFDQPSITPGTGDEGAYEIELIVVDEDGVESLVEQRAVIHALCAPS